MNKWSIFGLLRRLPGTCLLCSSSNHHDDLDICCDCRQELPYLINVCDTCSLPLPTDVNGVCGRCQTNPPHFDHTFSLFHYATPVDKLIQRLKFNNRLIYARTLGGLFAQAIVKRTPNLWPECIIPVPLHQKRLRTRGFNQAMELARPVAAKLLTNIDNHCCNRILDTKPQSSLAAKQRRNNIRHAFTVDASIPWKKVVIFDDVMTTGQTVNALAKTLKERGVEEVSVWCIARAIPS
ncbi:MAG: phosphoribosyltransferase family protein [Thiohalomonadales bacterium]